MFKLLYTAQARKDYQKIKQSQLHGTILDLLALICEDPLKNPPSLEKLKGNLFGSFSRRINRHHRLVYQIMPNDKCLKDDNDELYEGLVKIISMWSHYE